MNDAEVKIEGDSGEINALSQQQKNDNWSAQAEEDHTLLWAHCILLVSVGSACGKCQVHTAKFGNWVHCKSVLFSPWLDVDTEDEVSPDSEKPDSDTELKWAQQSVRNCQSLTRHVGRQSQYLSDRRWGLMGSVNAACSYQMITDF